MARDTVATGVIRHSIRSQVGVGASSSRQRAGVVLIMRNRKAVEAVLKHQGKAGADLGIALGSIGIRRDQRLPTSQQISLLFLMRKDCLVVFPSRELPLSAATILTENIMVLR